MQNPDISYLDLAVFATRSSKHRKCQTAQHKIFVAHLAICETWILFHFAELLATTCVT